MPRIQKGGVGFENDNAVEMGCRIKPLQAKEAKNNFCLLADCFHFFCFFENEAHVITSH